MKRLILIVFVCCSLITPVFAINQPQISIGGYGKTGLALLIPAPAVLQMPPIMRMMSKILTGFFIHL